MPIQHLQTDIRIALQTMAGSMLDAVVVVNGQGRIVVWNRAAESTFGWTAEEALGQSMSALIVPLQHRRDHEAGLRRFQATGEARVVNRRIEISALHKSGAEFPVELSIVPMEAGSQKIFVGFLRDISARRSAEARQAARIQLSDLLRGDAEAALEEACAVMGRHFDVARVGVGQLDPAGDIFDYTVCWTNGAVPPLIGRYPAQAFGAKIVAQLAQGETVVIADLLADPLSDEAETRATATAVDTRAILVAPFLREGRLRSIVYLNAQFPRAWTADEVTFMEEVAGRVRQLFERREAEAALHALNANLEARVEARTDELRATAAALHQAQKMEAIGQLTGGIAHDFNNLLQGIIGGLELAQKRLAPEARVQVDRFIDGALASAQRAAALTHRLLAFARRQPLVAKAVDANPLIAAMGDLLQRTLGQSVNLHLSLADDLKPVRCDPNQLESAILNLAINARDAMPDGGTLGIETCNLTLDVREGEARGVAPGAYVCIAVSDTGVGMDGETLARAFEPFYTTKPLGQGTGLGLSMIYGFVQQSDGGVGIESTAGQGTNVRLYLPQASSEAPVEASASASPPHADARGETILVVDDEPVIRDLLVEELRSLGYRVLHAADGAAGLELLRRTPRGVDLLVTDVGLPGLNGRQLAEAARKLRPELKVLFMTGYAEAAVLTPEAMEPGMDLIAKPFAMDAFAARLRASLGG